MVRAINTKLVRARKQFSDYVNIHAMRIFWVALFGVVVGAAAWGLHQLPMVNWKFIAAPVDEYPLTIRNDAKGNGFYGARRSGNRKHRGIDLAAPLATSVMAIRSGRVIEADTHPGRGKYVQLEHSEGLGSLYAHLDTISVETGEKVGQGQIIGTVGKTGNAKHPSIAPHLHLEITRNGEYIDPTTLGLEINESKDEESREDGGTGS